MFALVATAVLGLADDIMSVRNVGANKGGGMRFAWRITWLLLIASLGAWWFYSKLGWDLIHVPAVGNFEIGLWYLPLFVFIIVATAVSSNETDGLDGLNAGILIQAFAAFAISFPNLSGVLTAKMYAPPPWGERVPIAWPLACSP